MDRFLPTLGSAGSWLEQWQVGPMKNFTYLVGHGARALWVDPAWDLTPGVAALQTRGVSLVGALLTHHHEDHVNAIETLLARWDVPVFVQAQEVEMSERLGALSSAVRALRGHAELEVSGGLRFEAIHTPGHTSGSCCYRLGDWLFTGDTLFVDRCGRCDLPSGDPKQMYQSLYETLGKLPATTQVLPGHDYGTQPSSTLERERRCNPYLGHSTERSFVAARAAPSQPATKPTSI